jgi:DNA-binding transcriptional ArsR family regulator
MARESTAKKTYRDAKAAPLRVVPGGAKGMDTEPLDRLIHQRTRLAIVSTLAVNKSLTFGELKDLLSMSDGNLSVHTQKLEEAGYITCKKYFEGRKPRTDFCLTSKGRGALDRYLSHMESLVAAVRER